MRYPRSGAVGGRFRGDGQWIRGLAIVVTVAAAPGFAAAQQAGDAGRGQTLFQRQCSACHQIAQARNGVGPTLQGVNGRAADTVEGFNYSPAMKNSGVVWGPETLETYLANPTAMVKGTRMVQRVPNEQQRRDIIEFLTAGQ